MPATKLWVALPILLLPTIVNGQVLTLADAIDAAASNNRTIRSAELQRDKAVEDLRIARTHRLPVLSVTTLASQPITLGGVTFERGALGVYPGIGPIPGVTTTLESPLQPGLVFFGSVAQPLTQRYRMGWGIDRGRGGVEAASEKIRTTRKSTTNEVRRLYYGIVQAESARKQLQSTIAFLEKLNRETRQNVL